MALHGYIGNLDVLILSTIRSFLRPWLVLNAYWLAHLRKKQPIESHHVRALIRSYGHPRTCLPYLQMVSLVALGFCAFLRWSELPDLRACDLKFCATPLSVFLDRRKNDQFRQGSVVKVALLPSSSCPVKLQSYSLSEESINRLSHYFVSARNWVPGTSCDKLLCHILGHENSFGKRFPNLVQTRTNLVYIAFVQVVLPKQHAAEFLGEYGVDMVVGAVSKPQMVMSMNLWKIPLWYLEIWLFNFHDVICPINIAQVVLYAAVWRDLHLPNYF